MRQEHAAKTWVEEHFPDAPPPLKAALILAYGAGLDAGLAEAQELIAEMAGVSMAPLITDAGAFDRRTAMLRAAGFTHEANARDRFAHET